MITFQQFIAEAKPKKGPTATTVRNMLVKNLAGAEKQPSPKGRTSAYSDKQITKLIIRRPRITLKKVVAEIKALGFEDHMRSDRADWAFLKMSDVDNITLDVFTGKSANGKTACWVEVTGPKKAKPLTIPYYD